MQKDKYGHKTYRNFTPEEKTQHRDRVWGYKLRREYGITPDDYDRMFAEQNGLCAICEEGIDTGRLCVDHSHITGKVRGLLCRNCNLKLQIFEDNKFMERAKKYIEIHELRDKELLG